MDGTGNSQAVSDEVTNANIAVHRSYNLIVMTLPRSVLVTLCSAAVSRCEARYMSEMSARDELQHGVRQMRKLPQSL